MFDLDDIDLLDQLQLAAMVVAALAVAFYAGLLVGGKTIAVGEPVFPAVYLPNLLWVGGQATDLFIQARQMTLTVLWACVGAILSTAAMSAWRQADHSDSAAADADAD